MKTRIGLLIVLSFVFGAARLRAQDDPPKAPDASDSDGKKAAAAPAGCSIPEVADKAAADQLYTKKTLLAIYDKGGMKTCPDLEALSKTPAYKGRVAFARVEYGRLAALGIKDRLKLDSPITLTHYYLLDGTPARLSFDAASPKGTKYKGASYRTGEYFQTAIWRCLDVAPRDPAPKTAPERVQCFPECPHREDGWKCTPK